MIGKLEAAALAFAQDRGLKTVRAGELSKPLGWSGEQERKVLSRLARKGLVLRVRRGLYMFPPRLPLGGLWNPGLAVLLNTLMQEVAGRYQISGPNAFNRYGWTEQVPNRVYAYNSRLSGNRRVGTVELALIKVAESRLGCTEAVRLPEGGELVYATRARALVDAVYDWSRFDSLPQAYDWACEELGRDEGFAADLVDAALAYGNQATLRRIGALLERTNAPEGLLRRLQRALRPSSALIPWIPDRPKRGLTNKRWWIVFNDE
ncbi:MAG: type IV toxin-antitoxin system AbiEi family antitoxin domain-containing protein [Pirellulales bacterium]|nr:type IV toxin-antitoxin system AbiEi family antitoxin domain-containing protein [Pirellulales bacterium]